MPDQEKDYNTNFRTKESNIIWQLANREMGNFVQINKEIVFQRDENGQNITTLQERGLLFTIMCLQGLNWELNISGLATLSNCSKDIIRKNMKRLIELGYVEKIERRNEKGQFDRDTYVIHDTLDSALWTNTDGNAMLPISEKPKLTKPCPEKPCSDELTQYNNKYNNININNKINKDINNIMQLKLHDSSGKNLNLKNMYTQDTCNHDTCEHDSPYESNFSKETYLNEQTSILEAAAKLNNPQQSVTNPISVKEGQIIKSSGNIAQENDTQVIAEKTEEVSDRQSLKKANELMNRMEALEKELDKKEKKQTNRKNLASLICSYIEQDFADIQIQNSFKNWINALCEKGIGMTPTNYTVQKEKLATYPTDKEKLSALEVVMSRGLPNLKTYEEWCEIKNQYKSTYKKIEKVKEQPVQQVIDYSKFGLQYDENGDVIQF